MPDDSVRRQLDNASINSLGDALFADAAILVEGPGDKGILEDAADRETPLSVSNIVVANIGGKGSFFLPVTILKELGIPLCVVFDGDKEIKSRMGGKTEDQKTT